MSLREQLKIILNIKSNTQIQISKRSKKCQMVISRTRDEGDILCLKNIILYKYERINKYLFLYLKCLNNHMVIKKVVFYNKFCHIINLEN